MKRFLVRLLGAGCPHSEVRWPRRGDDGIDYVVCPECGHRTVSKIQFGKPEHHQRIVYQSPNIDEVRLAA